MDPTCRSPPRDRLSTPARPTLRALSRLLETFERAGFRGLRALNFDFGVTCLLDGLAVRLDQQEPSAAVLTERVAPS